MIRAVYALVVVTCGLALGPAALARTGPVRWAAPRLVDHSAPLSSPSVLRSVACPTATQCLSTSPCVIQETGRLLTSTDPTALKPTSCSRPSTGRVRSRAARAVKLTTMTQARRRQSSDDRPGGR